MAAALQKEMNDSITVVATTTLTARGRCGWVMRGALKCGFEAHGSIGADIVVRDDLRNTGALDRCAAAGSGAPGVPGGRLRARPDRKSTRLNSSHLGISY